MITDIPTKADFDNNGIAFLNLAWQSVLSISLNLPKQPIEQLGEDATEEQKLEAEAEDRRWEEEVERYWQVSQQELATAVALTQQGTEFLLKGKIAEVSPFLLISGDPCDWPSGCDREDIPFADFKTIDAQDLLRAHDTVCTPRFTDQFKVRFEQLRKLRNSVMHTVDRRLRFTTQDGVLAILEMVEAMFGPNTWLSLRRQHLEREPDFDPYSEFDYRHCRMAQEFVYVVDLLQRGQVRRFFDFDKKQRRYLCPGCKLACTNWGIEVRFAQLEPNTPESTNVFCFLCDETYQVVRRCCVKEGCPGNVFDAEYGLCLTCGDNVPAENDEVDDTIPPGTN